VLDRQFLPPLGVRGILAPSVTGFFRVVFSAGVMAQPYLLEFLGLPHYPFSPRVFFLPRWRWVVDGRAVRRVSVEFPGMPAALFGTAGLDSSLPSSRSDSSRMGQISLKGPFHLS